MVQPEINVDNICDKVICLFNSLIKTSISFIGFHTLLFILVKRIFWSILVDQKVIPWVMI